MQVEPNSEQHPILSGKPDGPDGITSGAAESHRGRTGGENIGKAAQAAQASPLFADLETFVVCLLCASLHITSVCHFPQGFK